MQILAIVVGGILGGLLGLVSALLATALISGSDLFGAAFTLIYAVPTGVLLGGFAGAFSAPRFSIYIRGGETHGQIRLKRLAGVIASGLGLISVVFGLFALKVKNDNTPPPDKELLANFERHENELNQIVEMVKHDKDLTRVDGDWTNPRDPKAIGVTEHRIDSYRRLLREVSVPRGFQTQGFMAEIDFLYWSIGSAVSSDITKGYAYVEGPAFNVVESLDGYKPQPHDDDVIKVYRHIRGNWYLFYEYIPG